MGQSAVCMDKGTLLEKRDTTFPHHDTFSTKIIPETDKTLDGRGDQEGHLVRDEGFFDGFWGHLLKV